MANPVRGEVAVSFGDRTLTLSFSVDAICQLEDRTGQVVRELGARILTEEAMAFKRTLLWAALRDHHPEVTHKAAGELMLEDGSEDLWPAFLKAWSAAWPIALPEAANAPEDPQTTPPAAMAAGTGRASSASGASSSSGRRKASGGKPRGR